MFFVKKTVIKNTHKKSFSWVFGLIRSEINNNNIRLLFKIFKATMNQRMKLSRKSQKTKRFKVQEL